MATTLRRATALQHAVRTPQIAPNLDSINNVENVFVSPLLGVNYSVTVIGRGVNVNAVTAQTNNVVQDYALVIACGEGEVTNAFTVTDSGIVSNPTGDQEITFVTTTNQPLLNQIVGASSPLLGTNSLPVGTNTIWGSNGVVTLGMTNQWHFYVVTNTGAADFTNAAFITFSTRTRWRFRAWACLRIRRPIRRDQRRTLTFTWPAQTIPMPPA